MNRQSLETRDFINVGIFTATYFVVFFVCGMLGYIPIFMLLLPLVCPLASGIPFMLYLTKVKKFGMVTMTGTICGVLMLVTGMSWQPVISGIVCGLVADLVLKSGDYKSASKMVLSYTLFSTWLMGMMYPLYFARDSYFKDMVPTYGQDYVDALMSYTPPWSFYGLIVLCLVGGFLGAMLGKSVLKRHFLRAGIV